MGCVLCELSPDLSSGLGTATDAALDRALGDIASTRSRLAAREAGVIAEIGRRKGNAADKLRDKSHMSPTDARRAVKTAAGLKELPATRDALESGEISPRNASLLAHSAKDRSGTDGAVPVDEAELVPKAAEQSPDQFAKTLRRWENEHRPDQAKKKLRCQRKARRVSMWEDADSGMYILHGEFDPITGARISGELAATTDRLWRDEHGNNPARPQSTVRQRRADALAQLICGTASPNQDSSAARVEGRRANATDDPAEPTSGGAQVSNATNDPQPLRSIGTQGPTRQQGPAGTRPATTLLVVADLDTVTGQLGNGRLANGTPLPADEIARLACEADIVPALFNTAGQPLWLGRSSRLATPAQRIAVIARDQGCIACGADPEWCQVHHIDWWTRGGPTDIDRLCLLCSQHHHLVHEGEAEIVTTDTGFQLQRKKPGGSRGVRAA